MVPSQILETASEVPPTYRTGLRNGLSTAFSFLAMLTMIQVTLVFTMAHRGMNDPDIWWHLRNAEYLFKLGQFPRFDVYSFTAAGHPWINHEWLAEIPYYLAWRAGGLVGIQSLVVLILEGIFLGLLYLSYKESGNFKGSMVACCAVVFLAVVSFGPRTILFGYAYLVVLLIILQRFRRTGHAPLWLLPPLFCVWVNTHGSWLLGLTIFCITAAAGLVRGTWGRVDAQSWTSTQRRNLLVTGLASVGALFINPFTYRLVFYPFDLAFRQKQNISHIEEWVSVDFHDPRGKVVMALLLLLLLHAVARDNRWTLTELGLLFFGLYSGLNHIRFLFLLAILVAPVMAKGLNFLPPYQSEIDKRLLNAVLMLLMAGAMVYYWPKSSDLQRTIDKDYPSAALSYMKTHPPAAPMLNYYTWGGYLGWNDRDIKVFVDSRVDIFEYTGAFQDYLDLLVVKEPMKILDKYQIRSVLFPPDAPLTFVLEHDPGWKVLYRDRVCVLFEKTSVSSGP